MTRIRCAVEPVPGTGIGEPEVGAAVDDDGVRAELFSKSGRVAVRQGQEHHVVAGQYVDLGGLQDTGGQRQEMRMMLGQGRPRTRGGAQRTDAQPAVGISGVAEQ